MVTLELVAKKFAIAKMQWAVIMLLEVVFAALDGVEISVTSPVTQVTSKTYRYPGLCC